MSRGLVIGLTGVTGHIGGLLLKRLATSPEVAEVRTVARRPLGPAQMGAPGPESARVVHTVADIASSEARHALDGTDLVYHLAAQVWRGKGNPGRAAMHRANVTGTANVMSASDGAVVVVSSVSVYGAWPGNPLPMDEEHVPRPNAECDYAQQKLAAEKVATAVAEERGVPFVVARLSAVLGSHADARVLRSVHGYRAAVPAIRGVRQAVQWLHEDDAVDGLMACGRALLPGIVNLDGHVVNLAPQDWLSAEAAATVTGGHVVHLPRPWAIKLSEMAHTLGVTPFGADRAALINGPLAVSPAKARALIGWQAGKSSAEVLGEALHVSWRHAPLNRAT